MHATCHLGVFPCHHSNSARAPSPLCAHVAAVQRTVYEATMAAAEDVADTHRGEVRERQSQP